MSASPPKRQGHGGGRPATHLYVLALVLAFLFAWLLLTLAAESAGAAPAVEAWLQTVLSGG